MDRNDGESPVDLALLHNADPIDHYFGFGANHLCSECIGWS